MSKICRVLGCSFILFAWLALTSMESMAQARPPQILEVYRDYLKPEAVAANRRLEKRAEHLCQTLDFRHPYLTIESVSGPAEMWYFNRFGSQAEVEKLRREYEQNTRLAEADRIGSPCCDRRSFDRAGSDEAIRRTDCGGRSVAMN